MTTDEMNAVKGGTESSENTISQFKMNEEIGGYLINAIKGDLSFSEKKSPEMISGISGAQKVLAAASLLEKYDHIVIIVLETKDIFRWEEDLSFFCPHIQIDGFPLVEDTGFQITFAGTERLKERMKALGHLISGQKTVIVASSVEAAQKIMSPHVLKEQEIRLATGDEVERDELLEKLVESGYERVAQVERSGHFAVRGDIIDIFPVSEEHPIRFEFFGDEIDSIRFFDEDSQRSIKELDEAALLSFPREEEKEALLFDYLEEGLIIYDEPQRCEENLKKFFKEESENKKKAFTWKEIVEKGREGKNKECILSILNRSFEEFPSHHVESWEGQTMTNYQRQIPIFIEELKSLIQKKWTTFIIIPRASEKEELKGIFRDYHIPVSETIGEGSVILINGVLSEGCELPHHQLAVITAGDILGRQKIRRMRRKGKGRQIRYFSDLNPGDYVVQDVHGIGKYLGIKTIELSGIHRDYIAIQYAGSDKLYLPVEKISTLEKYIGPEGNTPKLNKMGAANWEKIRSRAKKSIEELAEKLLDIYAKRELTKGISFEKDGVEQQEFEDTFPYVETEDQLSAIEAIKKAMEKPIPMDMLLCGDVGFGKTEVAMRAVFKCVMSGYQAMVLCPTTVLSEQHYKNFKSRMENFGVNLAVLNRFTSVKERKEILRKLKDGELDIIIGTHSILNKKLECKKLGLLVVDEEQRFGVVQKEKWKSWSSGIDVLTLSATPIPRTLHMSLTGVRDMVTITTPPSNRHSIQTYVTEYNDFIVKSAILREKERGGQTYFVYNRIESMGAILDHLRNILPEDVSIGVAYGRMDGSQLEKVMLDFYEKRYDVLLCTTLIENGLDQPNANTMIVYDADKLGLSQIYQMRGRVGRSDRIARAWFFYRKDKVLSEVAEKRLNAIREFTELGSGFKVAMRDLEIRGAGNLLGSAQHGNVASIGFATYCSMLEEAVERLRAKREHRELPRKLPNTTIEFRQDAYIDSAYIDDEEQKMEIYRRLASVENEAGLSDLMDEVIDRFGDPTEPVEKLFRISRIRVKARNLGIGSILDGGQNFVITWADETAMKGWNPMNLPKTMIPYIRILPGTPAKMNINKKGISGDPMKWISDFINQLYEEVNG